MSGPLLDAVVARRKLRQPKNADERESLARVTDGTGYYIPDSWPKAAQARMGFAPHAVSYGVFVTGLVHKCIRSANDELRDFRPFLLACYQALFDGYAAASAISGKGGDGTGKAFARGADSSRFESSAAKTALPLEGWVHADVAKACLDEWTARVPEDARADGAVAVRKAFGAGLLLHLYEHPRSHPDLVALEKAKPKKAKKAPEPAPAKMKENPALLAAILAAPHDDKPRLVFADWLQEHADPRAEFILVQCKLGRTLWGAGAKAGTATGKRPEEVQELKDRERELIKHHEAKWLEDIRPFIRHWQWTRGFVSSVVGDAAKLVEGLPALAKVPLVSMQLTAYKPSMLPLFEKAKAHPTLNDVELSQSRLRGPLFEVLDTPLFSTARTLDIWGNDLNDASRFAKCRLPVVERLNLGSCKLTDASLKVISEAPWFSRLTHLSLNYCRELTSLKPLAAAKSLQWLDAPLVGSMPADLKGLVARGLRVHYSTYDEETLPGLRALLGPPSDDAWHDL